MLMVDSTTISIGGRLLAAAVSCYINANSKDKYNTHEIIQLLILYSLQDLDIVVKVNKLVGKLKDTIASVECNNINYLERQSSEFILQSHHISYL